MPLASGYLIEEYLTVAGRSPYRLWLDKLDLVTKARIQARILRFEQGNLGDSKSVGKGVFESRLAFGPGYRIYFGIVDGQIILLLLGGDKGTQKQDIKKAQCFWQNFKSLAGGFDGKKK